MEPKDMIMPVLALLGGVISLYLDPKKHAIGKLTLLGALITTAGFTLWYNHKDTADKRSQVAKSEASARSANDRLDRILVGVEDARSAILRLADASGNPVLRRAVQANELRTQYVGSTGGPEVTIEYFPKGLDGGAVRRALQEVGLRTVEKVPQVPDVPTNAIWFGDGVSLDRVKAAALTLQRAGVALKTIRRFRNGRGNHLQLIQVGADRAFETAAPLTPEDVNGLTEGTVQRDQ